MGRCKKICLYILFISLHLTIASCFNTKRPSLDVTFYTIEYDPPRMSDLPPLSLVIRVERFSVASAYDSRRIIYRDESFKRAGYVYYKWDVNPGELVTSYLIRDMRESGLFKAALSQDSGLRSSYILEGNVQEFLEWDREDVWEAVLTLGITLVEERGADLSKRVLFQRSYHAREPCKQKHPRALAEAMSQAMAEVSVNIIRDVYEHLKD